MNSETILSHILTLCELIESSSEHPSLQAVTDDRLRQLRTAIDDYFTAREAERPPDLSVNVADMGLTLGDYFG